MKTENLRMNAKIEYQRHVSGVKSSQKCTNYNLERLSIANENKIRIEAKTVHHFFTDVLFQPATNFSL